MYYRTFLLTISALYLCACGGSSSGSDVGSGSAETPIVSENTPPTLSVTNNVNDIVSGQVVELSAIASDADGTISSIVWEQTAGHKVLNAPVNASSVTITLPDAQSYAAMEYVFSVTATDNEGATNVKTVSFVARNSMDEIAAARILHQGTMGPTLKEIRQAQGLSELQWLKQQMALPINYHSRYLVKTPGQTNFQYINRIDAWWKGVLHSDDQLRQRVAFALSQILVVSDANGNVGSQPEGMINYYDILLKHTFGNYRDLLEDVTLSPIMGTFLSHLGNEKANDELNIRPDENYAREVMQLFTIGLEELNLDATPKLDAQGNTIATYGQPQIQGFARVFTGWTFAGSETFKQKNNNFIQPMKAFSEYHSSKQKTLLSGEIIPAGYGPEETLKIALDNLFNHNNVAPFISKQLIQRLITSNPTAQYVARVASVFNDNGAGVRGDLAAVITAIYLDDEARHFGSVLNYQGKLKEPLLTTIQFWRNLDAKSAIGYYNTWGLYNTYGQGPMESSSVFNFFRPDYQPTYLRNEGLVAPELQIASDATLIGIMNKHYSDLMWRAAEGNTSLVPKIIYVFIKDDMNHLKNKGIHSLLDQYNILYFAGSMSRETRQALVDLDAYFNDSQIRQRISYLLYMVAISPEFNLQY
ncbi:hypothetical protein PTRA_a2682 [Pseudoalteromonas translucida KMM 520]|uniref:Ig-like domain-containing protein n=1 Tax=Pseudoalteromonas translucida KMM 520 TaxID=1315283 RepID=A0A0U2MQX5_9GAMM|nr:DUF1800 domain-containing protein [Pseudoalteromonas translucida]ALS33748.1 hypothetical protein PTRA_a2682 [Pseudoalteromonas translucida KMM 520]